MKPGAKRWIDIRRAKGFVYSDDAAELLAERLALAPAGAEAEVMRDFTDEIECPQLAALSTGPLRIVVGDQPAPQLVLA